MRVNYVLTEEEYRTLKVIAKSSHSKYEKLAEATLKKNPERAEMFFEVAHSFKEIYDILEDGLEVRK